MPRDKRPQYKKQIRIKSRIVGIPKGMTKDEFMKVHEFDQNEFQFLSTNVLSQHLEI